MKGNVIVVLVGCKIMLFVLFYVERFCMLLRGYVNLSTESGSLHRQSSLFSSNR